jgi:hypothetical protein
MEIIMPGQLRKMSDVDLVELFSRVSEQLGFIQAVPTVEKNIYFMYQRIIKCTLVPECQDDDFEFFCQEFVAKVRQLKKRLGTLVRINPKVGGNNGAIQYQ